VSFSAVGHRPSAVDSIVAPNLAQEPAQMNEAQLKALLRKTQAAAAAAKPKKNRTYDATLDATRPPKTEENEAADADAADLFAQMKKREF
jgi:hypothetical protein